MIKTKLLFIGPDLKFLTHLTNHFKSKKDFETDVYTFLYYELPDKEKWLADLSVYDIIFCEWGLGHLEWFSNNKFPGQKLITRLHSQEFYTTYFERTKWENVDRIICVAPHMMERFLKLFPELESKCQVINNLVDTRTFNLEKTGESRFNLGLMGILPKLKAPHLALEILHQLKKSDPRYKLHIKSKNPDELPWLLKRQEEKEYYENFFNMIESLDLKDDVIFHPHGSDVREWFQNIGFILSTSDREAFHLAVAEGMASGSVPIIRNWDGAQNLFPRDLIFSDSAQAASLILNYSDPKKYTEESNSSKRYCAAYFSLEVLLPEYDKIITRDIDREKLRRILNNVTHHLHETEVHERMLMGENRNLANQLSSIQETNNNLKTEIQKLKDDLVAHQETNNKLNNEVRQINQEIDSYRMTTKIMQTELKSLRHELKETQRHYTEMQNSLSWKVGSALVRKPASLLKNLVKK